MKSLLGIIPSGLNIPGPGLLDFDFVRQFTGITDSARPGDAIIQTALQPIFSLAHKRIVGYEALARIDGASPSCFCKKEPSSPPPEPAFMVFFDRLCRYIHTYNFQTWNPSPNWLFLNIDPHIIMHGRKYGTFFSQMLEACRLDPHRVVIELVEYPIEDTDLLSKTVDYYKSIGCLLAIDDFGAGHSNFERVWSLSPHIIKLDRSMLIRAAHKRDIRKLLPGIVALLHQAGAIVLMEGIETESQALIALEADVDLAQGYAFARPATEFHALENNGYDFDAVFGRFKNFIANEERLVDDSYRHYCSEFMAAVDRMKNGVAFAEAASALFEIRETTRCYRLEPSGVQTGETLLSPHYRSAADPRFAPLQNADNADWSRRHYLRNAIMHPGQIQATHPYLSITGENMCVTMSMLYTGADGNEFVFCCDFLWR